MTSSVFKEFDFVWAKFMNFNHWPAIIVKPDENALEKPKKDAQWVYFLGDHNYAWVEEKNIKPYEEFRNRYKNKKVDKPMREMEMYIQNKELDPNYQVPISRFVGKKSSTSKKKSQTRKRTKKTSLSEREDSPAPPAKVMRRDSDSATDDQEATTPTLNESNYNIGFFVGNMNAEFFLTKLLQAQITVYVWFENKKWAEKLDYLQYYAEEHDVFYKVCSTPQLAIANSHITFSCLSSPEQAKSVVDELIIADKNHGFLKGKEYVEMTSIVSELSQEIDASIRGRGGFYLEAMVQGNKDTEIQILAAGMRKVIDHCTQCFYAMGEANYLGEKVGMATDFHMAFQMLRGNMLVSMAEGVALANQTGFSLPQMRSLFRITNINSDYIDSKMTTIIDQSYEEVNERMQQLQRDLSQSLHVYDELKHPTPLTSNAHEIIKHCCAWGYGELDTSKIYQKIRY